MEVQESFRGDEQKKKKKKRGDEHDLDHKE